MKTKIRSTYLALPKHWSSSLPFPSYPHFLLTLASQSLNQHLLINDQVQDLF